MAEFAELQLEWILPVFENLKSSKLYNADELDEVIRKFRHYEYSLSKRTKVLKDYFHYADFVAAFVGEIQRRRKSQRFFHCTSRIEKPLKYKGATLYRMADERFKSDDVFRREIAYLRMFNLRGSLSQAFSRLLSLYGYLPHNHEAAGRFEFFENRSAENARVVLHSALRRFPTDVGLWMALFDVEIGYAKRIRKRVLRLQGGGGRDATVKKRRKRSDESDSGEVTDSNGEDADRQWDSVPDGDTDAVMRLRLAEIVYEQALEKLTGQTRVEFGYRAWSSLTAAIDASLPAGETLAERIYNDLAVVQPPAEEFILAAVQREKKVIGYDLYDEALVRQRTARMCRLYAAFCEERMANDRFAKTKLAELLMTLDELDAAESADHYRLLKLVGENGDDVERILRRALLRSPHDAATWERLIALHVRRLLASETAAASVDGTTAKNVEESPEYAEVKSLVDKALEKIPVNESLGVWRQLLELACATITSPKRLEKVFARAFAATTPKIAAELRAVRLTYLAGGCLAAADATAKADSRQALRRAYTESAKIRPTCLSLHNILIETEENCGSADTKLIEAALENLVNEFGQKSVDVWLQYLRYQLRNSPTKVGVLYKRAQLNLDASLVGELGEKWTVTMANS